MKRTKIAIIFMAVFLLAQILILTLQLAQPKAISATATDKSGKIVVTVLEAGTLDPIDNATVCIVETRKYYYTSTKGLTPTITVPIIPNPNFDLSFKRNYGELTILVYKRGYADSLNLYTRTTHNTTRVGFIVYLSPIINSDDNTPDINLEPPDQSWSTELIKLYKKQT